MKEIIIRAVVPIIWSIAFTVIIGLIITSIIWITTGFFIPLLIMKGFVMRLLIVVFIAMWIAGIINYDDWKD